MIAAILVPCLIALKLVATPSMGSAADSRPAAGQNNVWYLPNDEADTAIVFVHGLGSDSRGAWFHEGNGVEDDAYWPALVQGDGTFSGSAIFLGGFYSGYESHNYDFRDAANELHRALKDRVAPAKTPILAKPNIMFIAHSAGGIVVRDMLIRENGDFKDKAIGLVLIASPSIGTPDADRLRFIADFVRSEQGRQLRFSSDYLTELDKNFKNLVNDNLIPNLVGTEWLEHHLVFSTWLGLWRDSVLVDENTAARYFGESIQIADSDHVNIVKPNDASHESHRTLRLFYDDAFNDAKIYAEKLQGSDLSINEAPTSPAKSSGDKEHPIIRPITTEDPSAIPDWREAASPPEPAAEKWEVRVETPVGIISSSATCEKTLELDTDQVRHHLDLLKSADADELDQLDVLAALMCADRPGVRDLATRTALASPNPSVQAETLLGVMQQKQNIVVEFIEKEGISNEVRSYIQDEIALEYQFNHVEDDPSCIGLDTNKDCENYFLDITGSNVQITYGRDLGSFSLDENGDLIGFFKPANLKAKVPAKIRLL